MFLEYVEIAGQSTERARRVLSLIVLGAVLTFGAYWNANLGFLNGRIAALENVLNWRPRLQNDSCPQGIQGTAAAACGQAARFWSFLKSRDPGKSAEQVDSIAKTELLELQSARTKESRVVAIPIVGLALDVGDLWIFAGFAFTLLLALLVYAITREYEDTKRAFVNAGSENPEVCYDLLAARQLLSIPPGSQLARSRLWRILPKAFLVLPLAVQSFGIASGSSYRHWYVIDVSSFSFWFAVTLVAISCALTWKCWSLEGDIDDLWIQYSPEIPKG